MKRQNVEDYKMLTRVAAFAARNVGKFPKSSPASEIQTSLASAVRELAELSIVRVSAETALRSSGRDRTIARDTLKGLLAQADLTARALNSDKFRVPIRPSDLTLITCGRAFAADIEPLKKEFIAYGLLPDTVAPAANALELALLDYSAGKAKRSAAIREFDETLEVAMGHIRRFEALLANTLAGNPAAMAEWTMARSITRVAVRKRSSKPPDVVESATQPKAA